jgi:uncharacterized damage-inducible protein DinB
MRRVPVLVGVLAVAASSLAAQSAAPKAPKAPAATSLAASTRFYYDAVKTWLTKAAADMPEADYAFRPATQPSPDKKDIRTFGQILAHVADANFLFCGASTGMKPPAGMANLEQTKTTKADIQKALAASFDFCDKAWAATTNANASTPMDVPDVGKTTRLGGLVFNTSHDGEHYGNIVTYLRAKGMVPPSSQGG